MKITPKNPNEPDREYMNKRWCVRCNKPDATPFLKKVYESHLCELLCVGAELYLPTCVDLGCGNGRNTEFMRKHGFRVIPIDHASGTAGYRDVVLGESDLPVFDQSVGVVLANYVLMFLTPVQGVNVLREINRITAVGGYLVLEYYPAKDSWCPDVDSALRMQSTDITWFNVRGWETIKNLKHRAVLRKIQHMEEKSILYK
jgi:SAM-dependent methyltransferase